MKLFLSGFIWMMVIIGTVSFYYFITDGYNVMLLFNGIISFVTVGFLARVWKEIFYGE